MKYWAIEVWRSFPHLLSEFPDGPKSMRYDELGVYIEHLKINEQIRRREMAELIQSIACRTGF